MTMPTDDELKALGDAFDHFTRRYKLAEALGTDKPLNELDKQVLAYVARHGGCGPSDVARFLGVANTTLSSATDRLVKRDLIARRRMEGDRRTVALALTPAGRRRIDALLASYGALHRQMLEPLTAVERHQLIAMLGKITSYDG